MLKERDAPAEQDTPAPPGGWFSSIRTDLLVVVAVMLMATPFLREWTAQPASRYLFTAAVVDDHSFELDHYRLWLGADFAEIDGHVYSDKAPYQPLLMAPVYRLFRAAGGAPIPKDVPGQGISDEVDVGLWLLTFCTSVVPAAVLAVLMRRHVRRFAPNEATPVALALALGTVLLPFATELFGHMLAALTGFGAWYLLCRQDVSDRALVGAGVLLGASVGVEYPQVLVVAVVGIFAMSRFRWRAAWVGLGGFVALLPLLVLNSVIFGGPFTTAYQGYQPNFQGEGAFGVVNLTAPDPHQFALALIGDRGLFSLTPIMVMAVVGCWLALRDKTQAGVDAVVALVLLAGFLLISTGIDGYGGASPGPRYLVAVIPFFALPLAEAWRRWRPLAVVTAVWSAAWMVMATMTDPLFSDGGDARVAWWRHLVSGEFDRNIPAALGAEPLLIVWVALAAVCAVGAVVVDRRSGAVDG